MSKQGTQDERDKLASLARFCRGKGDTNEHTRKVVGFMMKFRPSGSKGKGL